MGFISCIHHVNPRRFCCCWFWLWFCFYLERCSRIKYELSIFTFCVQSTPQEWYFHTALKTCRRTVVSCTPTTLTTPKPSLLRHSHLACFLRTGTTYHVTLERQPPSVMFTPWATRGRMPRRSGSCQPTSAAAGGARSVHRPTPRPRPPARRRR